MNEENTFEYKEGRKLANQKDVAYILPSDQLEVDRLELNHSLWKHIIGSLYKSPIHDKLMKGIRVLDIGCGPGWWTLEMARLYPKSKFVGIDMANVFITKNMPSNVTFKIANAGTRLEFEDQSFDFVFQRFLVMGLTTDQYLGSIHEMKRILKEGGSIEILELINDYQNRGPFLDKICSWINQALDARHMDSFIANKIPNYLLNTGYNHIQTFNYNVPIGSWGGELGKLHFDIQKLALSAVGVMVTHLTLIKYEEYIHTLEEAFKEFEEYRELSTPVAVFKALTDFVQHTTAPTMSEFMQTLEKEAQSLRESAEKKDRPQTQHKAYIAVLAGVDLFMRFVNRSSHDFSLSREAGSFEDFRDTLLSRASLILEKASSARERVASIGSQFVHDNAVILVQGYSRVIMSLLDYAANIQNKRFKVYVTEARPESDGIQAVAALRKAGIPCRAVLDSAVGYIMDKIDMVFVGAEGVVENGGIVNKIGTFQTSLVANTLGKPVYAVAESYKFVRVFPLSQYDIPSQTPEIVTFTSRRKSFSTSGHAQTMEDLAMSNPSVDYTPPQYLTLLITDLGVLTPSGVSDELIKLTLA
ncbi:hypothetical protein G6F57_003806 [Rhizopus arrhizus]|uniref:Translation initiation factor eIF2B subunit alpha n=1 Tax=Rhizopus oryzae TaxID=64495 RepID=A0A9P6XAR1_RHIOR|nr:hypothetical protein G6F24_003413 [Rhizopus arrhizus]KAG1428163.1 hypothetical protein G6F58_000702 [Rhizopus delemar]KAG0794195.1 hypothetical protein G6F21_003049 [Rhizopus arrhizus]KAG0800434.1 hypothetical protein G6F22_002239 [Rhizopus arrhizus]KAG0811980.1 hypothetical protein G6F20_006724 [Rhizopus arrhizus]